DHDIVAAFGVELIHLAAADVDIVAGDRIVTKRVEIVARRAVGGAVFDPIVTLVAHVLFVGLGAEDEVVALAAEGLIGVLTGDDEVLAEAADDEVDTVATVDDVVAIEALDIIVAAEVGDDVIAGAAAKLVVAVATVDGIVALITPDGVVAHAGDHDVVAGGAAEHDVVLAGIPEVIRVGDWGVRVVANNKRQERITVRRVVTSGSQAGVLLRWINLEREGWRGEDNAGQVRDVAIRHDQLGEGVAFQFRIEGEAGRAFQVVEAVAVLQFLELVLEHEIEGRAQHAAEGHLLLGKTADPQVY